VALAWLCVLLPTLAFAAVGLLGSIVLGRSPMGLLVPAVLALGLNLIQMLPLPVVVRLGLPSAAFVTWRGLFTTPVQAGPLLISLAVDGVWLAVALAAAYWLFLRRDFAALAHDGGGRGALAAAVVPLIAVTGISVFALAALSPASGAGIRKGQVEQSLSTVFAHLYRLQAAELHRPDVTERQLAASATCDKGGDLVDDVGAGNDWRCVVSWHVPGSSIVGSAIYQLDVAADGRYVADGDGPKEVNGYFAVATPRGDTPNPLWQVDGLVDLLK
jgi:ABC-2 type transport system permease protein